LHRKIACSPSFDVCFVLGYVSEILPAQLRNVFAMRLVAPQETMANAVGGFSGVNSFASMSLNSEAWYGFCNTGKIW